MLEQAFSVRNSRGKFEALLRPLEGVFGGCPLCKRLCLWVRFVLSVCLSVFLYVVLCALISLFLFLCLFLLLVRVFTSVLFVLMSGRGSIFFHLYISLISI